VYSTGIAEVVRVPEGKAAVTLLVDIPLGGDKAPHP
jgi:hypothetical protein